MHPEQALREFHEFFGLPARDELTVPDDDEMSLRRTLIDEEWEELDYELALLQEEHPNAKLAKIYKELADLVYVVYGLDQHLGSKLSQVFERVHASNMTKLWDCWDCDGSGCASCKEGKRVKYREDGKVMKSPTYQPPDLSDIICT